MLKPRWPTPSYVAKVFCGYAGAVALVGMLFLIAVTAIARPMPVASFVAGVVAGMWTRRESIQTVVDRVWRMFPHHA
jgi:hypothetical protein